MSGNSVVGSSGRGGAAAAAATGRPALGRSSAQLAARLSALGGSGSSNSGSSSGDVPSSSSGGGGGPGGAFGPGGAKRQRGQRKASRPGVFEVKVITPPPRSLGVFELPPLTHNGEEIVVDGEGYVVQRLVLTYKLHKGRYQRDHNRLEVTPTGRWFTEQMLSNLMQARYLGPTGPQD